MSFDDWLKNFVSRTLASRPSLHGLPYIPYTTEFDRVVSYQDLTGSYDPDERYTVSEFAAQRAAFVLASGQLPPHPGLAAENLEADELAISILIDHSGSMRGDNAITARQVVEVLDAVCLSAGIDHEVLGFTTRSWGGGLSAKKWRSRQYTTHCGRLCDLLHIVYRGFGDRTPLGSRLDPMLDARLLKENIDGEAIEWAASRLEAHGKPQNRIIIVSDGAPVDDMTIHVNSNDLLAGHLKEVVEAIRLREGWEIGGIGIGYDCRDYYAPSVYFDHWPIDADMLEQFLHQLFTVSGSDKLL